MELGGRIRTRPADTSQLLLPTELRQPTLALKHEAGILRIIFWFCNTLALSERTKWIYSRAIRYGPEKLLQ